MKEALDSYLQYVKVMGQIIIRTYLHIIITYTYHIYHILEDE